MIDIYSPEYWATQTLIALYEQAVLSNMVTLDFSPDVYASGDTVNTRLPGKFTAANMNSAFSSQVPTATNVAIVLDQWWGVTFELDDKLKSYSAVNLQELYARPQAEALVRKVEVDLFGLHRQVPFFIGTGGTPSGVTKLGTNVKQRFDEMLLPMGGRNAILSAAAENEWHQVFYNTYQGPANESQVSGVLGERFGIRYAGSILTPFQASNVTGTIQVNANTSAASPTLALKGIASGQPVAGDRIRVTSSGVAYEYVIQSATVVSTQVSTVTLDRPLVAAAALNDAVVYATAHSVNLAFHRQAFGMVVRPPAINPEFEIGRVGVVQMGNLALRTQIWRDPKDKKTYAQTDLMYGIKTLDPAKAFVFMN